ncbi:hypothetical protein C0Q70_05892 [Pomacea canaliculata]|uniref:Speriolin C-terminal domain-containing protein n=2 Tax=Pomacea canaliculata TaxID=400727 RepID=A0A2T7PMG3_POMCA|nr:hypothetical protein C0Q70_05892 [Pomacea canaliculata]
MDLRRHRSPSPNALSSDRRSKERRSSDSLHFGRRFKSPTEQAKQLPLNNNAFTTVYCSNSSSDEDSTRKLRSGGWRGNIRSSNRTGEIHDDADKRVNNCKYTPSSMSTSARTSSLDAMPRSVSDLQMEIGRSRSFREGRSKRVEDAIQDLYKLFSERSQEVKNSRVPSSSPCRRYTHVLDSSQNRVEDDCPGDGNQQQEKRDRSPPKPQPQDAGDSNPPPCVLGEIGFQLERRIIQMVFGDEPPKNLANPLINEDETKANASQRHRFYGYTVRNLPERIRAECRRHGRGERDGVREADMKCKLRRVMQELRDCGYSVTRHSSFAQDIINKYGLFSQPPDDATITKYGLRDFRCVREHVIRMSEQNEREDLLVLLNCLHHLGRKVGKALLSFD